MDIRSARHSSREIVFDLIVSLHYASQDSAAITKCPEPKSSVAVLAVASKNVGEVDKA